MARKLSAYNLHVKRFAKANPKLGKNLMKKAAAAWNKKAGKPKSKSKTNKSKTGSTTGRKMARKKISRRRNRFTIPLSVVVPIAWKLRWVVQKGLAGDYDGAAQDALWHFAAIDSNGNFNAEALKTWIPVIAGLLVHKFVGGAPLNLNRYLKDVPLIRI